MDKKHVLVVDDAIDLGRLLQTTLRLSEPGLDAVAVPSAEEALLEATRYTVDLLITDLRLPGMSGFELVAKIRNRHPNLKVMMITGMTDDSLSHQAEEMKVDLFLHKPMDMAEFVASTRRLLGLEGAAGQAAGPAPAGAAQPAPSGEAPSPLGEALLELMNDVGAPAVLLVDERGRVISQVGEFPGGEFEERWAPVLLPYLGASLKVSATLGKIFPEGAALFPGEKVNLALAPVRDFLLVAALKPGRASRLPLILEQVLEAQQALLAILERMGAPVPRTAPVPLVMQEENAEPQRQTSELSPEALNKFEEIFESPVVVPAPEADSFWEQAGLAPAAPLNPEALSFDQARKLGLVQG